MRGKQGNVHRMPAHWRIIPAHAGQTCSLLRVSAVLFSDHPRACGANSLRATSAFITSGSSPRMRGKRVTVTGGDTDSRIIPAHAGQTPRLIPAVGFQADHPRACGANLSNACDLTNPYGSSPRMRGKQQRSQPLQPRLRIIPAHAGQTQIIPHNPPMTPDHPRACGANNSVLSRSNPGYGSSPRMRGKHR